MKIVLLLIAAFWIFLSPAYAQDSALHCPALDNPKTYKDNESYRYLVVGGENKNWIFRSRKDLKQDFTFTPETINKFSKLNRILKSKGKTLHIVMPPTRGVAHANKIPTDSKFIGNFDSDKADTTFKESLNDLQKAGISVSDFNNTPQDTLNNFYYRRDHHWTPIGAQYSAQQTAILLKKFQDDLDTQQFTTEETDKKIEIKGSFEQFIEKICNTDIPNQTTSEVKTFGEGDLFGDESKAAIALIGTSNTTEPAPSYANFAGYLREFIQSDVENLSIQGAGIFTPMGAYLASQDYTEGSHTHVIWELASHYDFNGKEFAPVFRQIIPAAAGDCGDKAIHKAKHKIEGTKLTLLNKEITSDNHYLHLKFDTLTKKDLAVSIKFNDSKSERFRFKREGRYPHEGIYFLDLDAYGDKTINTISLLLDKDIKAKNLNFKICTYPTL